MARKNPFLKAGTRLQSEGLRFARETGSAGATFVAETRDASLSFVTETSQASLGFVTETRDASLSFARELGTASAKLLSSTTEGVSHLGQTVQGEIVGLSRYTLGTVIDYVAALEESRAQADPLLGIIITAELESRVLEAIGELLSSLQAQLEKLDTGSPKKTTKKSAKGSKAKNGAAPLRNYDELTARDVVERIQRLSGPRASAVLSYEKARKNRATVIRAAQQRVGA